MALKKGDLIELPVEGLAFGARGIARQNDFVWFVERGIPGQRVKAKIQRMRKQYGEAYVVEVVHPSPHQVDPPCPYFGVCGGCQLQHLDYDIQVLAKKDQIEEILRRIGGLSNITVSSTLPSDKLYGYRNKMEFSFSNRRWLLPNETDDRPIDFALGLHVPRRFDKVLDIDACLLQSEAANGVYRTIKALAYQSRLPAYDIRAHAGFWRFLVIREGKQTGHLMVILITTTEEEKNGLTALDRIAETIQEAHPEVTTMIHGMTDRKSQVAFSEEKRLLFGKGKIEEKVGIHKFEISPDAFFQTNTLQTERLFKIISRLADLRGKETVYDLYCGTGAIGVSIAEKAKTVLGIEAIPSAIEDGKRNAALNRLSNMRFIQADMRDALQNPGPVFEKYGNPDIVILDPPRGGTHPKTVEHLLGLASPRLIYVSCNPSILARDLRILCAADYTLDVVQPVDMFPHTGHIEVVASLKRR